MHVVNPRWVSGTRRRCQAIAVLISLQLCLISSVEANHLTVGELGSSDTRTMDPTWRNNKHRLFAFPLLSGRRGEASVRPAVVKELRKRYGRTCKMRIQALHLKAWGRPPHETLLQTHWASCSNCGSGGKPCATFRTQAENINRHHADEAKYQWYWWRSLRKGTDGTSGMLIMLTANSSILPIWRVNMSGDGVHCFGDMEPMRQNLQGHWLETETCPHVEMITLHSKVRENFTF